MKAKEMNVVSRYTNKISSRSLYF